MKKNILFILIINLFVTQINGQSVIVKDPSFNPVEIFFPEMKGSFDVASDGSIFHFYNNSSLRRYLNSGILDNDFGDNGNLTPLYSGGKYEKYPVVAGRDCFNILNIKDNPDLPSNAPYLRLVKYANNGQVITGTGDNTLYSVPSYPVRYYSTNKFDNSVYISSYVASSGKEYIIKVLPNGQVDSVFGKKEFPTNVASNLLFIKDESLLVVQKETTTSTTLKITKLLQNGNVDNAFGNNGILVLGGNNVKKLYVNKVGELFLLANKLITKYTAAGIIDNSFGENGSQSLQNLTAPTNEVFSVENIDFDSANNILLFGVSTIGNNNFDFIARLNSSGEKDIEFNNGKSYFIGGTAFAYQLYLSVMGFVLNDNEYYFARELKMYISQPSNVGRVFIDKLKRQASNMSVQDNKKSNLIVYPSPTNDFLNIKLSNIEKVDEVKIMSMDGKLVKATNITEKIDVSNLPKGTYLIEVKTKTQIFKTKFIKK